MGPLGFLAVLFVSVAVIIAVIGQLTTISDYVGVKRPRFQHPLIAFLGGFSLILLLSAIVVFSVVPGSNTVIIANTVAVVAIDFSLFPYALALGASLWDLWKPTSVYKHPVLRLITVLVVGLPIVILLYPLDVLLPGYLPLIVGVLFTGIPILFSFNGAIDPNARPGNGKVSEGVRP